MEEKLFYNPLINEIEVKSANNGRIYLNGRVDEDMAIKFSYFTNKLIEMNKSSKQNKKITLLINSYGGSVIYGDSIIGNIHRLQNNGFKVIGICESMAYSMAYDIFIHCDERYAYNLSTFLLHQTAFGQGGELKEFEREVEFQKKLWEMSVDYYVEKTKLTRERINEIYDRKENYFFTAKEALENGTIQKII